MRCLLAILLLMSVSAWNWDTHQAVVDSFFYSLPENDRNSFNLSAIEEGSIAPDASFRDFRLHHYPMSLERARYWLNKAQENASQSKITESSYNLGVASHYIIDSYSAPHYIAKEDYNNHKRYEDQASQEYFIVRCGTSSSSLESMLELGSKEKSTWYQWLKSRKKQIPMTATKKATQVIFASFLDKLNLSCGNQTTAYKEFHAYNDKKKLTALAVLVIAISLLMYSVCNDLKRQPLVENDQHSDDNDKDQDYEH